MSQPKKTIDIQQINTLEELSKTLNLGLIKLYQNVLSSAPEYQQWSSLEVEQMFKSYLNFGNIYLAFSLKKAIGFGAIFPLVQAKIYDSQVTNQENKSYTLDSAYFTSQLNINPNSAYYIADLGVDNGHQRQGIGMSLMQTILADRLSGQPVFLRVSLVRIGAIALYQKLGFQALELYQTAIYRRADETVYPSLKMFMLRT